jgi:hypothetical protein
MWNQKRWHSPFFWAAFVIQGEYDGTIDCATTTNVAWRRTVVAAVSLVLLAIVGYALMKRVRRKPPPQVIQV